MKAIVYFVQFLSLFLVFHLWSTTHSDVLFEANANYQKGEKAESYEERNKGFNRALFLYRMLEMQLGSNIPALQEAIGNSFLQLGEYPWAILYYQRALKNNAFSPLILTNLNKAKQKLGLTEDVDDFLYKSSLIQALYNFSKQNQLLFFVFILTFVCCSLAIWFPYLWLRLMGAGSFLLLALMTVNVLIFYYLAPVEGILIASSRFYRAPDWDQPQLTTYPLPAGTKITVLQISDDGGYWVKVEDHSALIGFVPAVKLRLI